MSYSNPSYRGIGSDRFHREIWSLVLPYLMNHLEDRPFNLEKIAKHLHIPLEEVVNVFRMLRGSFQLFHTIQRVKNLEGDDLFSYTADPRKIIVIELPEKTMQAYSSYVYLWQQTGTHPAKLNSDLTFRTLLEEHPELFAVDPDTNQWIPSVAGKFFATQYQKYSRLNSMVPQLEYKQYQLILI